MKSHKSAKTQCDILLKHIDSLVSSPRQANSSNSAVNSIDHPRIGINLPEDRVEQSIEKNVLKELELMEKCPAGLDHKYLAALKRANDLFNESKEDEYSTITWDGYDYEVLENRKNKELQQLLDTLKDEVDPDTLRHLERLRLWRRRRPEENVARLEKARICKK